ncbi:MAG: methyltransferase, FxLD system [Candidatus Thermofonsia Clade 3 bacterium]|jgi:protein-L-isoaspartate(D-aspartate) O-methyltransferase|uniref:Protein-L-isoaspartate O-methyltransferase n=1 Tax=Candidatus Thermofonsia Clade 3 bacterium TaxID=2364212 RepID=A0A2M8QGG6_9CHLR|nr:methyltransferase domain-containing protein [Candidatus Roseilinea sp. NK_OTU-006]PJF48900.1 MAG: methyltransferase, FxLD system [Candidatus Thermofonsia Clade 3 bacterium]
MSIDSPEAIRLRNAMVDRLVRDGYVRRASVEAAFRATPRHRFVPRIPLREAYADRAIVTKQATGRPVSSISQPAMIAIMLEQLALPHGRRVLEIGTGTGYTAALMAHIVGESGRVVTVDIDEDLVAGAQANLAAAGCAGRVRVICGDGADGWPDGAPYDRIILAVGATDIAPAWRAQLQPDGRLVLPLDFRNTGAQFCIAFDAAADHLIARSFEPCGFIRLRGALAQERPARRSAPEPAAAVGMAMLATVSQMLPKVGAQLWRRRMNRQAFGRPTLDGLQLRAYPHEANYVQKAGETVHDTRWTRFVIGWAPGG